MRILMAAGLFSNTARYDNAVFALAKELSRVADVCVLSISRFPLPRLRPPRTSFDVVEPFLSWKLLVQCIRNLGDARRLASKYVSPYSLPGFLYLVRYLMNYSQIQLILESYRPDVVHVHGSDLERSAFLEYLLSNKSVPFLLTVHGLSSLDPNISARYDAEGLDTHLLKQLAENAVWITFVSSGIKDAVLQRFAITSGRLAVITNGVDIDRFRPVSPSRKAEIRTKYRIPLQRKVLIQVGTISRLKNHMFVLRCLASLEPSIRQRVHYVVVGDGVDKSSLVRFCRDNNLTGCCTFAGSHHGSELADLYGASDLLVIPSTSEAFPLVMLEGMAAGLPVLMFSDLWPVKDIANQDNTLLIRERTVESFNSALATAIRRNWNTLAIRAFAERFPWPVVMMRYYALYSEIVAQPRSFAIRGDGEVDRGMRLGGMRKGL